MGWARIDDDFPNHPKVWRVGPDGVALFLEGLCHAAKFLTDGALPKADVERMRLVKKPMVTAEKLVEVGLWERDGEGFRIHDYHDYNPTAEMVRDRRAATKTRVGKHRERVSNAVTNSVTNTHSPHAGAGTRDGMGVGKGFTFQRRRHPLEERPDVNLDAESTERAERFLAAFPEQHRRVVGSSYVENYERDWPHALRLVKTYSDRELAALLGIYLIARGEHFDRKPKTLGRLAEAAAMIEAQMRKEGQWPTAA